MDNYAVNLRKELWGMIDQMNEHRSLYVKNPQRDFTRKKKLPFDKMLKLDIQMQAKSLPHELGDFFDYNPNMPTASAFIQQRAKLTDYALPALFSAFTEAHKPRRMANGYRLIACDGSDVYFAGNSDEKDCYFESGNAKGYCLAHLNALQDVIGGTYLDALVQDRRCTNEIGAMITMVERSPLDDKTIFMADRGYECYNLMAHIQKRKQFYLLRVKSPASCSILSRLDLPKSAEFDRTVTVTLTRKQTNKVKAMIAANPQKYRFLPKNSHFDYCDLHNNLFYDLTFRVACVRLADDSFEYLVTNLPADEFSISALKELYHLRWGIETAFRELKYTVAMNVFHTKKAEYVRQEIFARLILFNFCQLVAAHAAVFRKSPDGTRIYKLNFSMVVGACRALLRSPLSDPPDTIAVISRFLVSVRNDAHFRRNKSPRKPVDAFYRAA